MIKIGKKLIILFLLILVFGTGYFFRDRIINYVLDFPSIKEPAEVFLRDVENVAKEVLTPPPLRAYKGAGETFLSRNGAIEWTNLHRAENGLLPLAENIALNYAANEKLQDMIKNEYFAHVSSSGAGVDFWVNGVDYQYIVVGENLALGNFGDDGKLVQAWMDSPGHRENILNKRFKEIGMAVGQGNFEGEETWLAVQIFAVPLSECPQPSGQLGSKIRIYEHNIKSSENTLNILRARIESIVPSKRSNRNNYIQLVEEYNQIVEQYNGFIEELEIMVNEYNNQVKAFNECASGL